MGPDLSGRFSSGPFSGSGRTSPDLHELPHVERHVARYAANVSYVRRLPSASSAPPREIALANQQPASTLALGHVVSQPAQRVGLVVEFSKRVYGGRQMLLCQAS